MEGNMTETDHVLIGSPQDVREMLLSSGYAEKAIDYFLNRPNMGTLPDADQVSELTGPCGDTMKVYLKVEDGRVQDAKIQVLGCPGAIASAMAAMEMVRGMKIEDVMAIKDRDIFRMLEQIPDQKQHCIRLTVKTIQKAIDEYRIKAKRHGA
jgi:nitrogen fixation NifU-like protein